MKTTKQLKKKLDIVFSKYIRQRDSAEWDGKFFRCISCNRVKAFRQMHNGHYYGRAIMATRFDEKNCNGQCISCNTFKEGNRQGYALGLQKKYGKDILTLLEIKSHNINKMANFEYETLIAFYSEKIK